ncbi:unnamed protein product, partial [Prorocentrum cordatum]
DHRWSEPPSYVTDSHAWRLTSDSAGKLGIAFGEWVGKVEEFFSHLLDGEGLDKDSKEKTAWCRKLRQLNIATNDTIRRYKDESSKIAASLQRMECYSQYLAFSQWAEEQYVAAPGKLFRLIKDKATSKDEFEEGQLISSDPLTAMDIRAKVWKKKWSDQQLDIDQVTILLGRARARAREHAFPLFDLETLEDGIRRMKGTSAKGIEQLGKRDLIWLPEQGKQELVQLFQLIEQSVAWPRQLTVVLVTLLRKPSGDDRAIGILSTLARLWSSCRGEYRASWTKAKAGHWDAAVAGSSALREALARSYLDETVALTTIKDWVQASVLWDIEGFYDALKWQLLLETGMEHDFPPCILALEMILHMGVRFLRDSGYYSDAIIPEQSMIAGLGGAVDFSRCSLYNILDRVAQGSPGVTVRSWVDDVSQRVEGRYKRVLGLALQAGLTFAKGCSEAGLVISAKSTIVTNNAGLGKELKRGFAKEGFEVKIESVATDLGIDRGTVGFRRPKQAQRRRGAQQRFTRVKRFAQGAVRKKIGAKLAMMGVLPMADYSDKVFGAAPSVINSWRKALGQTLAKKWPGRCLTTLLQLRVGRKDPQYQIVHRLVESWMSIIFKPGFDLELARRTWRTARRRIDSRDLKDRWRGITGVVSATIATLLDIGWDPVGPWAWISDLGERFMAPDRIIGQSPQDMSALKDAISDTIDRMLWDKASRHWNGKGLEEGADVCEARRHLTSLKKKGEYEMAGAIETVMTGASWTRSRISTLSSSNLDTTDCQRCKCGLEETDLHRSWSCSCNEVFSSVSSNLRIRAQQDYENLPCLWLRGILPAPWTKVDEPTDNPYDEVIGHKDDLKDLDHLLVGGDASGGLHSADARLRRIGWSYQVIKVTSDSDLDVQLLFSRGGGIPKKQTINRGETTALLRAAEDLLNLGVPITFVTDSGYVVNGLRKLSQGRLPTTNLDLWLQVKDVVAQYPSLLSVVKIESHMSVEVAIQAGTQIEHYLANALADEAAGYWANVVAVPSSVAASLEHAEAIGRAVRKHLAKAFLAATEAEPKRVRPTRSMAKKFSRRVKLSEHQVFTGMGTSFHCSACGCSASGRKLERFLETSCLGGVLKGHIQRVGDVGVHVQGVPIHESHLLGYFKDLQIHACLRCGCVGKHFLRRLANVCSGQLGHYGHQNLGKLVRGILPKGRVAFCSKQPEHIGT